MRLLLLDCNNLLCRAFFVGNKVQTDNNKPIGAICALATYIQSLKSLHKPTHIAMARDMGSKTWRHKLYPQYKKNRTKADEELYLQFPLIPKLSEYLEIPLLDNQEFEADDFLATLANQAQEYAQVIIVSTDKDLLQLVNNKIHVYTPHSNTLMNPQSVESKYLVPISRLTEYFALIGDASDNLPGVPGIGPKTALEIMKHCSSLDEIDSKLHIFSPSVQKKLTNQTEQIKLMKKLVSLSNIDLPKPFTPTYFEYYKNTGYKNTSTEKIKELFNQE